MKKMSNDGFSLLELVIAMAIFGVITLALMEIFVSSNKISTLVSNQATLQQELRNSGNLIVDEAQRAIYIYPPCGVYSFTATRVLKPGCTAASFPTTAATQDTTKMYVGFSKIPIFSSGNRGQKPTGGYDWEVGDNTAPFLAMIVAPSRPWLPCEAGNGDTNAGSCYAFVAYYAVRRQQVTRGYSGNATNGTTSSDLLEPDASNDNQWVIMEYRRNLDESMRDYSAFSSFLNNAPVLGVGTLTANGNTLSTFGIGNLNMPAMRWRDAGCDLDTSGTAVYGIQATNQSTWICDTDTGISTGAKLPGPTADPQQANQLSLNSLPALGKGVTDPNQLALFAAKMTAITLWVVKNNAQGDAKILVDNIEPNGFKIDFSDTSSDPRGATEVHLTLQGGLIRGGTKAIFPATPLEFFGSPRNISP
jgi:prepilin-type N-terminal cleavage/methylation domain-containing protein